MSPCINGEYIAIESPYRGGDTQCARYLTDIMRIEAQAGNIPLASHRLYPGVLDDACPAQRALGIEMGFKLYRDLGSMCRRAFYLARGFSRGMVDGLEDERGRQRYTTAQRPRIHGFNHSEAERMTIWPDHLPFLDATWHGEPVRLAWLPDKTKVFLRARDYPATNFVLEVY